MFVSDFVEKYVGLEVEIDFKGCYDVWTGAFHLLKGFFHVAPEAGQDVFVGSFVWVFEIRLCTLLKKINN